VGPVTATVIRPDLSQRTALSKVDRSGECWLWTGYVQSNGYAKTWYQGRVQWAHRIAWQEANGPIPEGMFVCHRCDVRRCVRPDHLFLGTQRDNMQDAVAKGRTAKGAASGPARRDHGLTCKNGHERATNTLYQFDKRVGRKRPYCGRCHADRQNARYHKGRAA
jgi:hypothetical protein